MPHARTSALHNFQCPKYRGNFHNGVSPKAEGFERIMRHSVPTPLEARCFHALTNI